jgi:amino acid adenylation domain-containing protein
MQASPAAFWLSPAQRALWSAKAPNAVVIVRLEGPVDPQKLSDALRNVVSRHEILRTAYRASTGMKFPFQVVLSEPRILWSETGAAESGLDALYRAAASFALDHENGPVVAATLASLDSRTAALILSAHPLTCDAASLDLMARETLLEYSGRYNAASPEDQVQYSQYAQWHGDLVESTDDDARKAKAFWDKFAGLESPLPAGRADFPEGAVDTSLSFDLHRDLTVALEDMASAIGSGLENLLFAAWQSFLARISGREEFGVEKLFSGRGQEELSSVPGLIDKYLPLTARVFPHSLLSDIAAEVAGSVSDAAEWQEFFNPAGQSGDAELPGFDYLETRADGCYGDLKASVARLSAVTRPFPVVLSVRKSSGELTFELRFDNRKYSRQTMQQWGDSLLVLLANAVAHRDTPVRLLRFLPESEFRLQFETLNHTEADYPRRVIQELFEDRAARVPERFAVRSAERELTYLQLNERANRIAHQLRQLGVRPATPVALFVTHGVDSITGLLAIMKAGGACMPLSTDNPKSRLGKQLENAAVILTEKAHKVALPAFGGPILQIEDESIVAQPASNPEIVNSPEDPAYIIYTSGSTGVPKGVVVRHRNLSNYVQYIRTWLRLDEHPEGLQFATVTTISADLGNTCLYPALLSGGCLHIATKDVAAESGRLAEFMRTNSIDVLKIVPSHLQALLDASGDATILPRRYLIVGGEALRQSLVDRITALTPACEILNHYGPTETTVGSLTFRLKDSALGNSRCDTIPIGRPIANTRIYILDAWRQPLLTGLAGELYISGAGVAAGYLNQPELTSERFLDDPWQPGEKMYRTGDRVRYLPDGSVEFIGRADNQVKIRGFRVELGEIETLLVRHPAVREGVVLVRPDRRGDPSLVAYVALRHGTTLDSPALCAFLGEQLPAYMVPAVIIPVPKIPLTSNGKIDRKALPDPEDFERQRARAAVPPRDATEAAIADIWTDVFRRSPIGVEDNFFDLGGHSLMATQVISRIRSRFGIAIDIRVIFDQPTIRALATAVNGAGPQGAGADEPEIAPIARAPRRLR